MEQISVTMLVTAAVDDATLTPKCPFAYTIANPIPLTTTIERA
jgi:hypothetical protein